MGLIAHKGIIYGGGSDVVPNPQDAATDELEKLGIDGDVYEVTDADYRSNMHTFTTTGYDTSTHKFEGSEMSMSYAVKSIFSPLATVYNAIKTAINDHAGVFTTINTAISNLTTALSYKVDKDSVTFKDLTSSGHRFGIDLSIASQFTGSNDVSHENTNLTAIKTVVNNLADYTEDNVQVESVDDTTPYLYRQSPAIGTRVMENALVGASVVKNQLVDSSTTSVIIASGHKYIAKINSVWSVGTSDGTAISVDGSRGDKFVDLTQYFGSNTIPTYVIGLGATNALAYLQSYGFLTGSLPYNSGTLESVNPSAKKVVGKNLFKSTKSTRTTEGITYTLNMDGTISAEGTCSAGTAAIYYTNNDDISALPPGNYYFCGTVPGASNCDVFIWDTTASARAKQWDGVTNCVSDKGTVALREFQIVEGHTYQMALRVAKNTSVNGTFKPMVCLPSVTSAEFEPYTTETYSISPSPLRGLFVLDGDTIKASGDVRSADGSTTRNYDYRAYQSDDESLANAITDGTHTIVKKSTPTTETLPPYTNPQKSFVGGTEEFITDNDVPVGHESEYKSLPVMFDDDYIQKLQYNAESVFNPDRIILIASDSFTVQDRDNRELTFNLYRYSNGMIHIMALNNLFHTEQLDVSGVFPAAFLPKYPPSDLELIGTDNSGNIREFYAYNDGYGIITIMRSPAVGFHLNAWYM